MNLRRRRIVLDIVLGGVLLILTLPVTVVLAAGSAMSMRSWPIFTQTRLGRGGRPFLFVKIRSLPASAPKYANKYEIQSVTRTRFGSFIRATHLDELPQLFLVVSGRMSLVGPRPEMQSIAATFDPEFMDERLRIRPGCTGLWQVSTAADQLIGEAPEYDCYYVDNNCIRLDLWILWRTVLQLLPNVEGVTLDDVPRWTRTRFSQSHLDSRRQDPNLNMGRIALASPALEPACEATAARSHAMLDARPQALEEL